MRATKKIMKRVMAGILVLALFFTSCEWSLNVYAAEIQTAESGTGEDAEENGNVQNSASEEQQETVLSLADEGIEDAQIVGELEELREESSKQFLMDDGTISLVQYETDVHYQDEEGAWQEIDNSLTDEEAGDNADASGFGNKEGKVKFKFAKNANANFLVRIMQGQYHIFFQQKIP